MNRDQRRRTRILIVDDHPIVRLGIRQMLAAERDLDVCGEAESAETAKQLVRTVRPDLAIVDLSLAEGTGLELIRSLRELEPALPMLVLSMHDEALFGERAVRAGARGYIMKREAITGLVGAIRHVLSGRIYLSADLEQALLERLCDESGAPEHPFAHLTDRELEVFDLIGRGSSTEAVAAQLGVSTKTVETYRSNLKTKLSLKNRRNVVRLATIWSERL